MTKPKSILITGAGSGIGRATAVLFAHRGWRVGLADIDLPRLAETKTMMPAGSSEIHRLDVRDRPAWRAALDTFTQPAGGALDVLFNNAGIGTGGPLAEADFDAIDQLVAVNLMGVLNGARIGFAYLARAGGCLLNTASASGIYGTSGLATYSATKCAVCGLTEALDGEWAKTGVRARDIVPGFVETPLLCGPAGRRDNKTIRETVIDSGLEIAPAEAVAVAAWRAVHGKAVHTYVGKTAFQAAFAARFAPWLLRRRMRKGF